MDLAPCAFIPTHLQLAMVAILLTKKVMSVRVWNRESRQRFSDLIISKDAENPISMKLRNCSAKLGNWQGGVDVDIQLLFFISDPNEGKIVMGFHKDLVQEVCKAANKKCVGFYDAAENCFSHGTEAGPHPGPGLLNGWFDGCLAWADSPFRLLTVDFTEPYLDVRASEARFYVAEGNPNGFDPVNIQDATLGILTAWAHNFVCLRSSNPDQFHDMTRDKIKMASTKMELRRMIVAGEVDAGFANEFIMDRINEAGGLEKVGDPLACATHPLTGETHMHVMTRKGSDVPEWWNKAFHTIKESGKYYKLCRDLQQTTDRTLSCID
ncbi:uncharacterized protein LOC144349227 [Saccoglossus kowalevskii]